MTGGGGWCKLPEPGGPEQGKAPDYVAYIFVFFGGIIIDYTK